MATFDSKTILMMAENGHSVEIDGKKIQMTIVQEAVDVKLDYSHLVGKWVKCIKGRSGIHPNTNEWVLITKFGSIEPDFANHITIKRQSGGQGFYPSERFDLCNPLDHNPDDVRVFEVPSEIKISEDSDGLNLHFSERQCLWYSKETHCYGVLVEAAPKAPIPCIATECKFEDLKEGDLFFATDNDKPDFTTLCQYSFLNNKKQSIWTDGEVIDIVEYTYKYYFKITPKP